MWLTPASSPLPWDQHPTAPIPPAAGPPPATLAGFWRRLLAAFLDWILVGIVASAVGALFGVDTTTPPPVEGEGFQLRFDWAGPYILVAALPCFLGFFWMLWDRRKQTWHDMVANSLVVRASAYPPGEFGRPAAKR